MFIWVSRYLAWAYVLGTLLFYVSNWRRDRHFTRSSEPHEGLATCSAKEVPSFRSYFKTLSIGLAPGIEPATFRSALKRSTDWANPAGSVSVLSDYESNILMKFCDKINHVNNHVTTFTL